MTSYNGEKYIKEQIDSIIKQLGPDDELIISDDGSNDNTCNIIMGYNDPRIRLLHNHNEHGFVGNFENALTNVRGEYIFLSDQDDVWKENKVKVVMQKLQHYELVIHNAELIDGNSKSLGKTYYDCLHKKSSFIMNLWKNRWLGCCMAFHRKVLEHCLPFPKKIEGHDYWIGMLGMLKFKYCFMEDVLMSYRRHGNNTSSSGENSNTSLFYKIFTKRLYLLGSLLKRFFAWDLCK